MSCLSLHLAEAAIPWTTIIWAAVVVFFLVLFRTPIAKFLERLSQFKVKADKSGVELSFDTIKAQAELARAMQSKSGSVLTPPPDTAEIAQTVREAATHKQAGRFSQSELLWVDDNPSNNVHERRAFEAIGLQITLARSTEQAQEILNERSFAVIISDMGRPPDARAGYTLLDKLRQQGNQTPFIIYAGSRAARYQRETAEHGGQGCTNHPEELFKLVTKAIIGSPKRDTEV